MTEQRHREIVIVFERQQTIRKRARTELRHCEDCGTVTDTLCHATAAELFELSPNDLYLFIRQNHCHYDITYLGKTYICVNSLLERMHQQNAARLGLPSGEFEDTLIDHSHSSENLQNKLRIS